MPDMPPTFRAGRTKRQMVRETDLARGTAAERGYGRRWMTESGQYKAQHPLCVGCKAVDRVMAVEVTDHIVPHRGNQDLFWDRENWQSACRFHHDTVKQKLEVMFDRGQIGRDQLRLDSQTAIRLTLKSPAFQD
jgi:5-methylcytosine-specific restriction endonuclease McrA